KKKKMSRPAKPMATSGTSGERPAVTRERFGRLCKLVRYLSDGAKTRDGLTAHLGLDVRGFYRDLKVLSAFGVAVSSSGGLYSRTTGAEEVLSRLPFPDPHLTLGEMQQLAKGRTLTHRRMQELISQLQS